MTKANFQQRFLTTETIGCLSETVCDLQIAGRDGVVRTHQAILSWSSGFLRRLFSSHFILEDGGKRKEDIILYLKDYTVEVITAFVNFMFNGEISTFASADFIEDFKKLWEDVRVDRISYSKAFEDGRTNARNNDSQSKSFQVRKSLERPKKNVEKPVLPAVPPKAQTFTPVRPSRKPNLKLKSPHENLQKSTIQSPQTSSISTSTPRMSRNLMKKPSFEPKVLPKIPDNTSSAMKNSIDKPVASSDGDDDAIIIIDEVKSTNPIAMVIKRELPPGISITKNAKEQPKECENVSEANVDVGKSSSEATVEKEVPVENNPRKVTEINPLPAVPMPVPGPQVSKDLRRLKPRTEQPPPKASEQPPRKMSRRSAAAVVSTYNLDKIEEAVFESAQQAQQAQQMDLSKSHQEEIVAKTKNLRIPLTKISAAEGKTDHLRPSPPQPKSVVLTPNDLKTPFKVSPKVTKTPGKKSAKKVISEVSAVRPGPEVEAITCYICRKSRDAKGETLCLKNLSSLRQHVSLCLYEAGKLSATIPESEGGTGKVYSCEVEGCWLATTRGGTGRSGYKEYAIHKASQHGAMDLVLSEDGPEAEKLMESIMEYEGSKVTPGLVKSEDVSNVTLDEVSVPVVKEKETIITKNNQNKNQIKSRSDGALLKCRFQTCSASFKPDSKREIKLHYASQHFADYFGMNPSTGVPDNFLKVGNRTVCQVCSNNTTNKPVYIQSEKEAIRGHLVVKHDIMSKLLSEVTGKNATEASLAFQDIYQTP